jgi:hypothetical protein
MQIQKINKWHTSIFYDNIGDQPIVDDLLDLIENHCLADRCSFKNSYGNAEDISEEFFKSQHPTVVEFRECWVMPWVNNMLLETYNTVFNDIQLFGWVNYFKNNTCVTAHHHDNKLLTGCFYLKTYSKGGHIIHYDPRFNFHMNNFHQRPESGTNIVHKPKKGDIVMFPCYVWHETTPWGHNIGNLDTISDTGSDIVEKRINICWDVYNGTV